jgi:predicted PhzF superfamily epimerase YddE/YHI9
VTVRGSYSAALAAYIEEEVGVPPEKQIWLEEETWKRENEINP